MPSAHSSSAVVRAAQLLCFCVLSSPVFAQRYLVHVYEEVDGLPSTKVASIAQDSTGRMWFATRQQLASYDGMEWVSHGGGQTPLLEDLGMVMVDPLDRIWALPRIATRRGGLYADGQWSGLPRLPSQVVEGARWAAATTFRRNGEQQLIGAIEGLGAFLCDGQEWTPVSWPAEFDARQIRCLQARDDELFVGTTSGLLRVTGSFQDAQPIAELGHDPILALATDPKTGDLWVLSHHWLARMSEGEVERVAEGFEVAGNTPNEHFGLACDWLGGAYFGDSAQLRYYKRGGGVEPVGRLNGTLKEGAWALFVDREGNIWISNLGGLSKIVSQRFANFDVEHGLRESEVTSALMLRSGQMILGHPRSITRFSSPHEWIDLDLPDVQRARVLDLEEDLDGNLWIAAQGRGLGRLDLEGTLTWFDLDPKQPEGTNSVLVDDAGVIWVSESRSLFRGTPDRGFERVAVPDSGAPKVYLRKLFRGSKGRVYVATSNSGLYIFEGDAVRRAYSSSHLLANDVYALTEDSDGAVLVGTAGGLCRLDGERLIPTQAPNLVLERPVYLLLYDTKGRLWCGTDDGVVRWDGAESVHYTVEDGLVGREINRDGGAVDSRGDVWIGTESGVSVYRERFDIEQRPAPGALIEGVSLNGTLFAPDEPTSLGSGANTILFSFRGIGFVDEQRLEFRYRLENFDMAWHGPQAVPGQSVRYTNLPPGRYRFQLQARGPRQPWSEVVSSGELRISEPFWSRTWFILVAASGLAFAMYGLVRAISRHRYMRQLEREVQLRVEENRCLLEESEKSRKLESLGVLAGGIAHDFNNLLTVMMGSFSLLETNPTLSTRLVQICRDGLRATSRAQALTQQLLTFSKGGAPLLRAGSIADVVRESARFVMRGSNVSCDCDLPSDLWVVEMDPDQISQVISNLLLNATQASREGGTIHVSGHNLERDEAAGLEQRYVEIRVKDQGCGIPADQLDRIFDPYYSTTQGGSGLGLATSYSIAQRHGGKLLVESSLASGSTFRILIPAAKSGVTIAPTPPKLKANPSSLRVLLMDDEEEVRLIIGRMLQQLGHEVSLVTNGTRALAEYNAALQMGHPFDVVLVDLTIPGGMGGKELISHLLKVDPKAQAIVISGYSNDPVLAEYRRHGFIGRLSKPISFDELSGALGEVRSRADSGLPA